MKQDIPVPKLTFKIEGTVLDKEKKPIKDVSIAIHRHVHFSEVSALNEFQAKADGNYAVKLDTGEPVIMRVDAANHHPVVIDNLSGSISHLINITMQKTGLGHGQDELLEILSAYERLYFIDEAPAGSSKKSALTERRKRYRANLAMVKYINPLTEERYKQVFALYSKIH